MKECHGPHGPDGRPGLGSSIRDSSRALLEFSGSEGKGHREERTRESAKRPYTEGQGKGSQFGQP